MRYSLRSLGRITFITVTDSIMIPYGENFFYRDSLIEVVNSVLTSLTLATLMVLTNDLISSSTSSERSSSSLFGPKL
jgi:hypothetical protein